MAKEMNFRNTKLKLNCSASPCARDMVQYLETTKQMKSQAMSRKEASMKQLLCISSSENKCDSGDVCNEGNFKANLPVHPQLMSVISNIKQDYAPDNLTKELCIIFGDKACKSVASGEVDEALEDN